MNSLIKGLLCLTIFTSCDYSDRLDALESQVDRQEEFIETLADNQSIMTKLISGINKNIDLIIQVLQRFAVLLGVDGGEEADVEQSTPSKEQML